jgi:LPXTG-site transpeptidase (sortase) family protein
MDKEKAIKTFKIAAILYVASFIIINWNDVSWIFNYKEVSGLVGDFFNPYPSIDASSINAYFYPNHNQTAIQEIKEIKTFYTDKQSAIEIPKISISVPIIFSQNADKTSIMKDLDKGVVYYPGSVYPGQVGQILILGHSAPVGWPKIKHDWVFSDLEKLSAGDKIMIDLNNKQYNYTVRKKTIIQRGADVPVYNSANNVLTLISCWPPGKDYQRIAVQAELDAD